MVQIDVSFAFWIIYLFI